MSHAFATFKKLGTTDLAEVWLGVYRLPTGQRLPCLVHRLHSGLTANDEIRRAVAALAARLLRQRQAGLADVVAAGDDGEGTFSAAHEYAPGVQLDVLLQTARAKRVGLSAPMAVNIAAALARTLASLHEPIPGDDDDAGPIFLRLLAPQSIRVGVDGEVRLHGATFSAAVDQAIKSFPGAVFNQTRRYLAPEVAEGHKASVAGDLYGLGVILWEALAQRDYDAKPIASVAKEVPAFLASLVTRCLSTDPSARPASAESVARDLSSFLNATWPRYDSKQLGIYAAGVAAKAIKAQKAEIADALSRDDLLPPVTSSTNAEAPRLAGETHSGQPANNLQVRRGKTLELNEAVAQTNSPDLVQKPARRGEVAWDAIVVPPDLKRPRRPTPKDGGGGGSFRQPPPRGTNFGFVAVALGVLVAILAVAFKSGLLKTMAALIRH